MNPIYFFRGTIRTFRIKRNLVPDYAQWNSVQVSPVFLVVTLLFIKLEPMHRTKLVARVISRKY